MSYGVHVNSLEKPNPTLLTDTVHLGYVLSTEAHAEVASVDASEALVVPGVVGYFDINVGVIYFSATIHHPIKLFTGLGFRY